MMTELYKIVIKMVLWSKNSLRLVERKYIAGLFLQFFRIQDLEQSYINVSVYAPKY